jgi:3-hydroxy-9,10-secoandrosta-1,3,5(10)-triene-9,17-dione monooxygenase reductase component
MMKTYSDDLSRSRDFRRLVGRFPTGVSVVLGSQGEELIGLTINSFTSVSLDPLLLLFCTRHESRSAARLRDCRVFTVNVLGESQLAESQYFAGDRASVVPPAVERDGELVWLKHANASFCCELGATHPAGDHMIIVARVTALMGPERSAPPLVYHEGAYARLADRSDEKPPMLADARR